MKEGSGLALPTWLSGLILGLLFSCHSVEIARDEHVKGQWRMSSKQKLEDSK